MPKLDDSLLDLKLSVKDMRMDLKAARAMAAQRGVDISAEIQDITQAWEKAAVMASHIHDIFNILIRRKMGEPT